MSPFISPSRILADYLGDDTASIITMQPLGQPPRPAASTPQIITTQNGLHNRATGSAGTSHPQFTWVWPPGQSGSVAWAWGPQFASEFGAQISAQAVSSRSSTTSTTTVSTVPSTNSSSASNSTAAASLNVPTQTSAAQNSVKNKPTIIIAAVCSALLVICFLLAIFILVWRRRRHRTEKFISDKMNEQGIRPFELAIASSTGPTKITKEQEVNSDLNGPFSGFPGSNSSGMDVSDLVQQNELSSRNMDLRNLRERIQYLEAMVELPPPDYPDPAHHNNNNTNSVIQHST